MKVTQEQLELYRKWKMQEQRRLLLRKGLLSLLDAGAEVEEGDYTIEIHVRRVSRPSASNISDGIPGGQVSQFSEIKEVRHLVVRHKDE